MDGGMIKRPKAILFDWDNTLVDTWPCIIQAMNKTLVTMGQSPWSEEEAKARIAKSMRETFPVLFGERCEEAKTVFQQSFKDIHIDMLTALPGAQDLLTAAHGAGVYLGVVSNKTGAFLRTEADHLGWTPYFGTLVGAGDAERDKPACDPVHMALAKSGISPGPDVWFVGDNAVDVQCGAESGCVAVLIHPDGAAADISMTPAPHHVFCDCSALQGFLLTETVPFQSIK
jgi:phosphoglycolate phosphatase